MGFIKRMINKFKTRKQTTFCYCPKCRNELTSSDSFVYEIDGIVKYRCDKCRNVSFWDFIHYPVPVLRTCAQCEHFYMDKVGQGSCSKHVICSPDTMYEFSPKGSEEE